MKLDEMNPAPPVTSTRFATGLDLLLDGVEGPAFDLALDSAQALSDEGEDEALDPEPEQRQRTKQQRAGEVGVVDPVEDPVDGERGREQRRDHPEDDADPLDRLRPEACEHVQREPREAERGVARASRAGGVRDVHLDHRGAAGEDQRLRELLLPDGAEHRLDGRAPIRVEGAAEVGDLDLREAAQHPVDHPARQRPAPRVVAGGAAPGGDVVARLDRLDEPRNVLGLVLEVAVHRHQDLALCAGEARVHRRVLAEVALEADPVDARVGGMKSLDRGPRAVGRAVVDDEDLPRPSDAVQHRGRACDQLVDGGRLVVERDHERQLRRLVGPDVRGGNDLRLRLGHRRQATRLSYATIAHMSPSLAERGRELLDRLTEAARELASSRAEVGAVRSALGRLLGAAEAYSHLPPEELRRLVEEQGRGLVAARERASASIAIMLRERLEDASVLTHSASATVREALLVTPPAHVFCTVSSPVEEGIGFAEELRDAGLPVTLLPDEAAPSALERASVLLLGADTVF